MRAAIIIATAVMYCGFGLSSAMASNGQAGVNRQATTQSRPAVQNKAAPQAQAARTNQQRPAATQVRQVSQSQRVAQSYPVGISCVPYVRQATGMAIRGNGGDWWHNAAGLYARGHAPEAGAILAFSRTGQMRSGHVAVVQEVISAREILIHHANWAGPGIRPGSIMQDVSVIDVSLHNDWSAVRVQVGRDQESLGRIYPIQGFIYDRHDDGYMRTAGTPRPGGPVLSNARSLRPEDVRGFEEVAQAPARSR
jgi:surface antigen